MEIQELAIVVRTKNYDPSLLSPSFLKSSGIVPEEWELAKQPILNNRVSQIIFNNGIYLTAQSSGFTFVEALSNKEETEILVPQLVNSYIEILRNLEFQAVGINFRGYIPCNEATIESNNYLKEHFIRPGEWQNCGTESVKAGLNLSFTYDDKKFFLTVSEAGLKFPEQEQLPVILFGGNFDYDLSNESPESRLSKLQSIFKNWQSDLHIYQEVIKKMNDTSSESNESEKVEAVAA